MKLDRRHESKAKVNFYIFCCQIMDRSGYTTFHLTQPIVHLNHKRWAVARMMPHFNCLFKSVKLLIKNTKKWLNRVFHVFLLMDDGIWFVMEHSASYSSLCTLIGCLNHRRHFNCLSLQPTIKFVNASDHFRPINNSRLPIKDTAGEAIWNSSLLRFVADKKRIKIRRCESSSCRDMNVKFNGSWQREIQRRDKEMFGELWVWKVYD